MDGDSQSHMSKEDSGFFRFLDPNDTRGDEDAVDAPYPPKSPLSLLFNPEFRATRRERRPSKASSWRSSTTSIDSIALKHIKETDRSQLPMSQIELESFARELANAHKRMTYLKEALQSSWVWNKPNYRVPGGGGNTLLHVAAKIGEARLVSALVHLQADFNAENDRGDTPMHLAAEHNRPEVVSALLKGGEGVKIDVFNRIGFKPTQIAAIKGNRKVLETLLKYDEDYRVLTPQKETLLHLACRGHLSRVLSVREEVTHELNSLDNVDAAKVTRNFGNSLEAVKKQTESQLLEEVKPLLERLLNVFWRSPDLLEIEDLIPTSPGTILHYFCTFNYLEGVQILMELPFVIDPSLVNKNDLAPLTVASFFNYTQVGIELLDHGADPNVSDPRSELTPLHFAIYGYHIDRVQETCDFIEKLLDKGADPKTTSLSGEAPAHLVIGTLDFRVMSKFIDYLGPESLSMKDDGGNTLFHHAVSCLDEEDIFKLIKRGADLMSKNNCEQIEVEDDAGFFAEFSDLSPRDFYSRQESQFSRITNNTMGDGNGEVYPMNEIRQRTYSVKVERLPVQEAMKNGNSKSYFNALRKVNFERLFDSWNAQKVESFLTLHILAATREVRPDIVRLLFQQVEGSRRLHKILLFCDKGHDDETFTKTALEWAVENDDRLCTTEILHQEYECHKESKREGLNCLRRQLTGDELLTWTIETFSMFYERTFAQTTIIPFLGLTPLFLSIFTFVFDYYSDIELTAEYYRQSTFNQPDDYVKLPKCLSNQTANANCTDYRPETCIDIDRTPHEYRAAFIANVVCLSSPLLVFYCMCSRELLPYVQFAVQKLSHERGKCYECVLNFLFYPLWVLVSVPCAPFFILYVAVRNVVYKFRHRRAKKKNIYRKQLQKSEYLWGISRTAEAGLESCGQLILQVWLLSSDFKQLSEDDFWTLIDKTYNGVIFFLTFSFKHATDIEKSLGKLFMSLVALVAGVAACYRTLKRGAVRVSNTYFIYLSLLCQVFARIFSIGLFFFAVREFYPFVFMVAGHLLVVYVIKFTFERARHTHGMLAWLVAIVNVIASSLVYVRIMPIRKQNPLRGRNRPTYIPDPHGYAGALEHSTFFVQSLFFLLVLVENVLLASTPFMYPPEESNRALACLGRDKLIEYIWMVIGLCVLSWIFHTMYYKYMGHPWSDINGPEVGLGLIGFQFHFCGTERKVEVKIGGTMRSRGNGSNSTMREDLSSDDEEAVTLRIPREPSERQDDSEASGNQVNCCIGHCSMTCETLEPEEQL